MFRKILLATDGSAPSLKAADLAAELVMNSGAEVVILFVIPSMPALAAHKGAPYFHETAQTSEHLKQLAQQVVAKTAKVFEDNHIHKIDTAYSPLDI
jgi:nucleotide-binding universal stress UspA family protein